MATKNFKLRGIEKVKKKDSRIINILCLDCKKEFEWYKGTLRCGSCAIINNKEKQRKYYQKLDNHKKIPMAIINSKADIIGKFTRSSELKKWFLENTNIEPKKLLICDGIFNYLESRAKEGSFFGRKLICFWIMKEEDYTLELAKKLINGELYKENIKRSKTYTKEFKDKIINIFNEVGLQRYIALKYGVSRSTVNHIKTGLVYSDITHKKYEKIHNTLK